MNTITLTFPVHPNLCQPLYSFGDRVALIGDSEPDAWATGAVVGISIGYTDYQPYWLIHIRYDSMSGFCEDFPETELVAESAISMLQAAWEWQADFADELERETAAV